ncbi:MAG TPA: 1-deoxy-D-xylulose-5-phosphate synthase [Bacteroidetes bacterium]|nr:1-deoxy-D-xylulose-5-phosphate synthase [Bacteroidota bacterium]
MSDSILQKVNYPKDLKNLSIDQLNQLTDELRHYLLDVVSTVGGHLAPGLGVVELTVALHYVFNTPQDKIVWDVGHQAYIHKILTGRKDRFPTIRQLDGISGFPKIDESEYDTFGVGHASTSISAALGMACARDHFQEDYKVIAVIGDGAMTGGIAFEGLNNAGMLKKDLIVILNDNKMSISPNVGALAQYLTSIITAPSYNKLKDDIWELTGRLDKLGNKIRASVGRIQKALKSVLVPGVVFERLGFRYFGPVDGHNLTMLIRILNQIKNRKGPILVHILTKKGKGYLPAENNASIFHGLGAFDQATGTVKKKSKSPSYTEVFGKTILALAQKDKRIVGITAAMADGTGLIHLRRELPDQFYDVGIAEQHAVTFACGLALQGMKPVVAIYSTFLQRAFDQLIHDVGIQKIPLVFALDRAGLVGGDGATHHGAFDLSYLRLIPNFVVMAPKDEPELQDMLQTAIQYNEGPVAIRYPRGTGRGSPMKSDFKTIPIGESETLRSGVDIALLGVGKSVFTLNRVADLLAPEQISARVENMRFIKPLDKEKLSDLAERFSLLVTLEDNTLQGGFGSAVREFLGTMQKAKVKIVSFGLPDQFVDHGSVDLLQQRLELTPEKLAEKIGRLFRFDEIKPVVGMEVSGMNH